ncbi:RecBCD enzyme subunit RecD [Methanobrevibacter cuticularis]|uniref:RecBCD enzyme subunit RecD n=1 Tax=Methanobrevibacter cuticularis TaxID=47311 RepID=A0A166FCS7_9EURY|nr:DUF3320 domain-containing protein [Methanobrevibacter cuticularis]KZX17544.1 RecBCD enzyme subunit RecD [Methanobrevibacter cuticularis]
MGKSSSKKIEKEFENLRKKLLDLTSRNQLLNFKHRAKTLEVINNSPNHVYQTLILQKKKMHFVPNKEDNKSRNSEDSESPQSRASRFSGIWDHSPIDLSIFKDGNTSLKIPLSSRELQKRLFYINQQARLMFQEQGYNILYLAIGFLEWRDNVKPKEVKKAPLVLIPVLLERKKVGKSFSISWNEEDIQTNISLQAKLREEGLELPEFTIKPYTEAIDHYLRDVRNTIAKSPSTRNWKVVRDISIGFFSFTKFVMYNDLNPDSWKNIDLTKHELVDSIFNPKVNQNDHSFNAEEIDKKLSYENMYHVLDADSSQIAAIEDVKAGRNLVVEGPPGTGKSQTIVNLIAELLAEDKSVLFVSEKMAALEVVKSRLDSVGLGKFTLEIHSHKTRRKQLLKELKRALNKQRKIRLDIDQTIRKLESLKNQLDDYAEVIHQENYGVKMSPFELYGLKEVADDHFSRQNTILPLVRMKSPEAITKRDLDDMIIDLENLAELYSTLGKNNPWNNCAPKSLLPGDLREIELLIQDTLNSLDEFNIEASKVYETYGIKEASDIKSYKQSLDGLKLLDNKYTQLIDSSILTNKEWVENPRLAYTIIENLEDYQMTSKVMEKFKDSIVNENLDDMIAEFEKFTNRKFKLFGGKGNKEEILSLYTSKFKSKVSNDKSILNDLKAVREHIKFRKKLQSLEESGTKLFGELWHLEASVSELKDVSNWMREFNHFLKEGIYSKQTIDSLYNSMVDINAEYEMKDYVGSGDNFYKNLKKLESKLNPRNKLIFKKETDDVSFDQWKKQLNTWKGQLSSLHLWSQYLNTKNACLKTQSSLFVKSIEDRNIKKDDVRYLIYGNFADSLLNIIFTENEALATFVGELHENRITDFKDLDSKIIELNRKRIFNKLNEKIPNINTATDDEEIKVLKGELTRKSGHLPVRKLLEKSGGIIKQIKPCFMMSPLSIAQYLDPTNPKLKFDVVIFDEASQVKPEDALGAFMRAETAVVMGDTQQLPPTSFFDQLIGGESEEEIATALDMESILHLCKLSFPVKMLKWHYRSRHESLINISNHEFYDDQLLVYPSPSHNTESLGLKFKYNPKTYYDRGKSSANRIEAQEVAKEVLNHFDKYGDTKSLGVGTFSVAQMNAILEELEFERKQHPELEHLFSDKKDDRFFVKNLETIQGDERDVILISVGYGYDTEGKMSLNFGPLNQDGGERRLNVLITRAKEKCVVFANFKSYDMHLTANPPFGVKALKNFLEYSENISKGIIHNKNNKNNENFEDAIANFLEENGYTVDKQVGSPGFKIDLAIVDDQNPGKYILGIECDGEMYYSSKVARDRDRLRDQVLTGLGWNLYHLWSTDWYRNRELARTKLLNFIEKTKIETFANEVSQSEIKPIITDDDLSIVLGHDENEEYESDNEEIAIEADDNLDNEEIAIETDNNLDNGEIAIEADDNLDNGEIAIEADDNLDNGEIAIEADDNLDNEDKVNNNIEHINDEKVEFSLKDQNKINIHEENLSEEPIDLKSEFSLSNKEKIDNSTDETDNFINNLINSQKQKQANAAIEEKNSHIFNKNNEITTDTKDYLLNKKHHHIHNENPIHETNKIVKNDEFYDKVINTNNSQNNLNNNKNIENTTDIDNKKLKFRSNIDFNFNNEDNNIYNPDNNIDDNTSDLNNNNNNNINNNGNISDLKNNINNINNTNGNISDLKNNINNINNNNITNDNNPLNDITAISNEDNADELEEIINSFTSKNYNNDTSSDYNKNENSYKEKIDNIVESNLIGDVDQNIESHILNDNIDNSNLYDENKIDNLNNDKDINNIINNEDNENFIIDELINTQDLKENDSSVKVYKGAKTFNSPLRKNNVFYSRNKKDSDSLKHRIKSVSESITEIKNEVKYINDSLKEIENPTAPEEFVVIDRTKDPIIDDLSNNLDINNQKNSYDKVKSFNEDSSNNINKLQNQISENLDGSLEDIIQDINKEYVETEKQRYQESNQFKTEDDRIISNDDYDLQSSIVQYTYINEVGITSSKELYDASNDKIAESVNVVVNFEGPIHKNEVILRIREKSNIKRTGVKIKKIISDAINTAEKQGSIVIIDDFLFPNNGSKIPVRKRKKPNIDLIANEEIEENIKLVLKFNSPIDSKKLIKQVSKNFGFKSTSKKTSKKINNILDYMLIQGDITNNNNDIESTN